MSPAWHVHGERMSAMVGCPLTQTPQGSACICIPASLHPEPCVRLKGIAVPLPGSLTSCPGLPDPCVCGMCGPWVGGGPLDHRGAGCLRISPLLGGIRTHSPQNREEVPRGQPGAGTGYPPVGPASHSCASTPAGPDLWGRDYCYYG